MEGSRANLVQRYFKEIGDETSVIEIIGIKVFGYQDNIKFNNYKKKKKKKKKNHKDNL